MATLPCVELPGFLKGALASGHPWVYRDHLPRDLELAPGAWVRVRAGRWSGYALYDAESPIALRVFSGTQLPDPRWVSERVERAWRLRQPLRAEGTNAYRWLFGEGDQLPGMTVDVYGPFAVVATYASSLEVVVPWLVSALRRHGSGLRGVVRRRPQDGQQTGELEPLWGRLPPRDLVVQERGVRLHADLHAGQKTALFLDHRDNRVTLAQHVVERRVLNLFCYTGAFSVRAALAGAKEVVSVDASAAAIAAARDNFALNGLSADQHELVVADAFEYLQQAIGDGERFEVVLCDPPSFARSSKQLAAAVKAYERLHALGLQVVGSEGLYAAASCTAQIGPDRFRSILADSARRVGRRFQIVHEAGQPLDHPVMAHHPEGRYLKFLLARVLPTG